MVQNRRAQPSQQPPAHQSALLSAWAGSDPLHLQLVSCRAGPALAIGGQRASRQQPDALVCHRDERLRRVPVDSLAAAAHQRTRGRAALPRAAGRADLCVWRQSRHLPGPGALQHCQRAVAAVCPALFSQGGAGQRPCGLASSRAGRPFHRLPPAHRHDLRGLPGAGAAGSAASATAGTRRARLAHCPPWTAAGAPGRGRRRRCAGQRLPARAHGARDGRRPLRPGGMGRCAQALQ